jgi:phosphate starvation-inducible protein PhoH and related proteins
MVAPANNNKKSKESAYQLEKKGKNGLEINFSANGIKCNNVNIEFLNDKQRICAETINKNDMTFITGPAGTSKTFIGAAMAIKALEEGVIDRIYITRPTVTVQDKNNEGMGYLKGDMVEKMTPYLLPLFDSFDEILGDNGEKRKELMDENKIIIVPIEYIRGRTLKNCYTLADECQNLGPIGMRALLSRIGPFSKMIISGDVSQDDQKKSYKNYLANVADIVKSSEKKIAHVKFSKEDNVRHPTINYLMDKLDILDERIEASIAEEKSAKKLQKLTNN